MLVAPVHLLCFSPPPYISTWLGSGRGETEGSPYCGASKGLGSWLLTLLSLPLFFLVSPLERGELFLVVGFLLMLSRAGLGDGVL